MPPPIISIVVPCYNQAEYLDECLQSVLDQTYADWECIIVNDGSPDNTEETAIKWIEKDARFKYFFKENGGVSSARNFGIDKALGEWILPLDSDDKIGNQYLELASKEFQNNYEFIYCKAEYFGNRQETWVLKKYNYSAMLILNHIFCSVFYRKTTWSRVGGYDSSFIYGVEDWDFILSVLQPSTKVLQLDYVGFYYRRSSESRDTFYNNSEERKIAVENQIYKKHLKKYLNFDKHPIVNFNITCENAKNLKRIKQEIRKNFITRFLYKIIEILQ